MSRLLDRNDDDGDEDDETVYHDTFINVWDI